MILQIVLITIAIIAIIFMIYMNKKMKYSTVVIVVNGSDNESYMDMGYYVGSRIRLAKTKVVLSAPKIAPYSKVSGVFVLQKEAGSEEKKDRSCRNGYKYEFMEYNLINPKQDYQTEAEVGHWGALATIELQTKYAPINKWQKLIDSVPMIIIAAICMILVIYFIKNMADIVPVFSSATNALATAVKAASAQQATGAAIPI